MMPAMAETVQNDEGTGPAPADALLASDLAAEVKAEFLAKIDRGQSVAVATQAAFVAFRDALASPNDGPVVLLALAALQWREGQLQAVIRDAAVDLIDSGEALAAYKTADAATRKGRRDLLEAFAEQLREAAVAAE